MITGDMNAKVGADNTKCDRAMGKHGCGVINDNGRSGSVIVRVRVVLKRAVVGDSD